MFGKRRPVGGHAGKDADGFGWAKKGCRFPQCAFLHDPAKKYLRGSAAASDRSRAPAGGSQAGAQARGQARAQGGSQLALPLCLATRRGAGSAHPRGQLWEEIELQLPGGRRRRYTRGRHLYLDQVWSRV